MTRPIMIAVAALLLGACGSMGDLAPPRGEPLPVKPLMARATPTPEQLLTPPANASPDRVDELMRRSAPRVGDRFDLPPPSGGAPARPVEAEEEGEANDTGPVEP